MPWPLSGTLVPPLCAGKLDGVDDDDPVAFGSDQLFGAELTKDAYHDLTNRTDSVGQFPLAHKDVQFTACEHALGGKVEQVPSDPLANRRECAAGNLGDKTLHPFAELGEQGAGDVASGRAKSVNTPMSAPRWQYRIVSVRPSGAVRKTRTTPLMSSSKYGALSASRWVTDPAGIRVRTEPTMRA